MSQRRGLLRDILEYKRIFLRPFLGRRVFGKGDERFGSARYDAAERLVLTLALNWLCFCKVCFYFLFVLFFSSFRFSFAPSLSFIFSSLWFILVLFVFLVVFGCGFGFGFVFFPVFFSVSVSLSSLCSSWSPVFCFDLAL